MRLPDRPTNNQFLSADLDELGKWFSKHDVSSRLDLTCIYCGSMSDQTDHVIPKSRGGSDDPSNMVPACRGCNAQKGTMTPKEWLGISNAEFYHGSPRHLRMARQ